MPTLGGFAASALEERLRPINFDQLREQYRGTLYAELIQHHLERQTPEERRRGLEGTRSLLPTRVQPAVEGFIDRWNERAFDAAFWQRDTVDVMDAIVSDARALLASLDVPAEDETLFNVFNIVTMSYAYSAADQPKMRAFMGLNEPRRFPVWSALSLLVPVVAFVRISSTPASATTQVGYALAQLGYVMFAAGVITGTYGIFGLKKRVHVIGGAIAAFAIGTALSNIGL